MEECKNDEVVMYCAEQRQICKKETSSATSKTIIIIHQANRLASVGLWEVVHSPTPPANSARSRKEEVGRIWLPVETLVYACGPGAIRIGYSSSSTQGWCVDKINWEAWEAAFSQTRRFGESLSI